MSGQTGLSRTRFAAACLLAMTVLAGGPTAPAAEPPSREYVLGVFPHLPPRDIEDVYAPIASDLGKQIGKPVVLASSTSFERFAENLDRQMYDIAMVQPFDYVRIADRFGYLPLATRSEKLAAVLVVKQNSRLSGYADLRGKRLALPPKTAAVSMLALAHLDKLKLKPGQDLVVSYYRSHISCMQQVVIGEADACGTAAPAVRIFERKMNVKLKLVDSTREIPHTLFAIHPRVPKSDRETIRRRILSWNDTEAGREILSRGTLTPFVSIRDADYNVVRSLSR